MEKIERLETPSAADPLHRVSQTLLRNQQEIVERVNEIIDWINEGLQRRRSWVLSDTVREQLGGTIIPLPYGLISSESPEMFEDGLQRVLTLDNLEKMLVQLGSAEKRFTLYVSKELLGVAIEIQGVDKRVDVCELSVPQGVFWVVITEDGLVGMSEGDNSQKK